MERRTVAVDFAKFSQTVRFEQLNLLISLPQFAKD